MGEHLHISAKTGQNVPEVLEAVVRPRPAPAHAGQGDPLRALVFDSVFDVFRGVVVYVRVVDGTICA
jgi:GTP-binding protein LepA